MEKYPLVSILSTFKDSKEMLTLVADSVLLQDYPNIEHIIIDSVSKDGSIELLKEYESKYSENNFSLIWKSEPDRCIADGANKAAKLMSGSYFMFITNPFISSESLGLLMKNLISGQYDAVCGGAIFHRDGMIIRRWRGTKWHWRLGWMAVNEALCIRSELYEKYGPFQEEYINAFDYDFQLRVFMDKKVKIKTINKPIVYFYAGGTSNGSIADNIASIKENYAILKSNNVKFAWFTVLCKCFAAFLAYTFVLRKDISHELPQKTGNH